MTEFPLLSLSSLHHPVLHLSFPLCPSSSLLFITPLIKAAHPERTEFRGGGEKGGGGERDEQGLKTRTGGDKETRMKRVKEELKTGR